MERNSLCNNLKDHSLGGKTIIIDKNKAKDHPWKYHSSCCSDSHGGSGDLLDGLPWPPKSYTCSFCKREFRSAQALGGHMNVHRRDRARLRLQQSPPRDHINGQYPFLNPNPNFSYSSQSSSSSTRFHLLTSTLTPLVSAPSPSTLSSPPSASLTDQSKKWGMDSASLDLLSKKEAHLTKMKNSKALFGVGEFDDLAQEGEFRVSKKAAENVRLDLDIGVLSSSKVDDLDLELRLGYS